MRGWLVLLPLLLGAVTTDTALAQSPPPFPESVRKGYLAGCFGAGDRNGDDMYMTARVCPCRLHAVESTVTLSEFEELLQARLAGTPATGSPAFARLQPALQVCDQSVLSAGALPASSVQTDSYSIPIPAGFFAPETMGDLFPVENIRTRGGLMLVQRRRPAIENAARSTIVILPAPPLDPTDEAACKARAAASPPLAHSAAVVRDRGVPRCEIRRIDREWPNHGLTHAALATPKGAWTVTCSYDVRDQPAVAACAAVLDGWRFTPP